MPSTGPQDVVFCKNVTIYFRTDVTRKLIQGLHDTLAPDGYLLLGHAESLWQMSEGFDLVEREGAFCYQKRLPAPPKTAASKSAPAKSTSRKRDVRHKAVRKLVAHRSANLGARSDSVTDPLDETASRYEACLVAFRSGDWYAAESSLTALVAACPTFVPGLLLLGGLYAHRGRFDEALTQAESVLMLSDLEPRAHLLLGMIAARQQRTDEAFQSLRRALYLDDSLALAHFWLGNLYRDRGEIARACQEYENVVRDWERHTLELTEEFASDLTAEQLVAYCRDSLERFAVEKKR